MTYPKPSQGKRSFDTPMGAMEKSPARMRRDARRRRSEERRWAARASEVRILTSDELPDTSSLSRQREEDNHVPRKRVADSPPG